MILLSILTLADSLNIFWISEGIVGSLFIMGIGLAMLIQRNRAIPRPAWRTWIGGGMVALGGLMLIDTFLPSFVSDLTWPFALIGAGALLLWQWSRRKATR